MPHGLTTRFPKHATWIAAAGLVGFLLLVGGVPAVQAQPCIPPFPPPTPPILSKSFGVPSIPVNGTTTLTFVLTNQNCIFLTGIAFSDQLPPGLIIATPNGLTVPLGAPPCVGAITATEGSTTIGVASVILHPKFFTAQSQCTFSVNVIGTTPGTKDNTTSAVTANETDPGATASASLAVVVSPIPTLSPWASLLLAILLAAFALRVLRAARPPGSQPGARP